MKEKMEERGKVRSWEWPSIHPFIFVFGFHLPTIMSWSKQASHQKQEMHQRYPSALIMTGFDSRMEIDGVRGGGIKH